MATQPKGYIHRHETKRAPPSPLIPVNTRAKRESALQASGTAAPTAPVVFSSASICGSRYYAQALSSLCTRSCSLCESARPTTSAPNDAPCALLVSPALYCVCVCGYFTARAALYSIKLVHSQGKCDFPFQQRAEACPMAMATQPKGYPPT
jgi:hypothetical protein